MLEMLGWGSRTLALDWWSPRVASKACEEMLRTPQGCRDPLPLWKRSSAVEDAQWHRADRASADSPTGELSSSVHAIGLAVRNPRGESLGADAMARRPGMHRNGSKHPADSLHPGRYPTMKEERRTLQVRHACQSQRCHEHDGTYF